MHTGTQAIVQIIIIINILLVIKSIVFVIFQNSFTHIKDFMKLNPHNHIDELNTQQMITMLAMV